VNNAATLGDLQHTISEYDPAEVATYMTINVSSPMIVRLDWTSPLPPGSAAGRAETHVFLLAECV